MIAHPHVPLVCSSGVEKVVRLVSPVPLTQDSPSPSNRREWSATSSGFSFTSLPLSAPDTSEEDSRTLAMFDLLNARERDICDTL